MQSRRNSQRRRHPIRLTLVIIILIFLCGWTIYAVGNHPKNESRQQAVAMAKKYANLKKTDDFYIYNREKTYYTVAGTNKKNQSILVVIAKKGGKIRVLKQKDGITKNEALTKIWNKRNPKRVLKIAPGIFNNHAVWEVTYLNKHGNLCYELLNFKNGKDVQRIDNL